MHAPVPCRRSLAAAVLATAIVLTSGVLPLAAAGALSTGRSMAPSSDWKKVDRLASEAKLEAAASLAEQRLEAAKAAHDEEEWTRALIKVVQLRAGSTATRRRSASSRSSRGRRARCTARRSTSFTRTA